MNVKTFGVEINSIIENILIKRTTFDVLINKLNTVSKETIDELDSLIQEINLTIQNINNTLNQMENILYKINLETETFLNNEKFYLEVLPILKDKFIVLFESYLELFNSFEIQIRNYLEEKIDTIVQDQNIEKEYLFNIFNYDKIKEDVEINNIYNKKYSNNQFYGYSWYSGKFDDSYLKKDIVGSLELLHIDDFKNKKNNDFLGQNGNNIYENVIYHPDYGMVIYRSVGKSTNNTNYRDFSNNMIHEMIDIITDDNFSGEIVEEKNTKSSFINIENGIFLENKDLNKDSKTIPLRISLSHIASNNTSIDRSGLVEKFFIHKIKVLNCRNNILPSMFYIGQNKDLDNTISVNYVKTDNATNESILNVNRNKLIGNKNNLSLSSEKIIEFYKDNNENLLYDKFLSPINALFQNYDSSHFYLTYRNKKMVLLESVLNKNADTYTITNYILENSVFGIDQRIIGTSKKGKRRIISDYDLFYHFTPKIINNNSNQYLFNDKNIKTHKDNYLIDSLGVLFGLHPFGINIERNSNLFISTVFNINKDYEKINQTKLRNDYRKLNFSYYDKFLSQKYGIKEVVTPEKINIYYLIDHFSYLKDGFNIQNNSWFIANNKSTFDSISNPFGLSLKINSVISDILTGDSLNLIDDAYLFEKDINSIISNVLIELSDEYREGAIGTLKYIPYDIENPKLIFNGTYAKAGSVLNRKEYPEAHEVFKDKYLFEALEPITSSDEFALPAFNDKYIIGAKDETEIMQTIDDALPLLNFEFEFDHSSSEENSKYNGLLVTEFDTEENTIGVNEGIFGKGAGTQKLELKHKSKSSVTKGNDFRVDIYIRVK